MLELMSAIQLNISKFINTFKYIWKYEIFEHCPTWDIATCQSGNIPRP